MTSLKVSFIIPVFNGEATLRETLFSIVNQTEQNFELIVVDNGSVDRTKAVIEEFPKAKYLYCERRGRSFARNAGAKLATAPLLAFIDCDTILSETWLEEALRFRDQFKLDCVATKIVPQDDGGGKLDRFRHIVGNYKYRGTNLSINRRPSAGPCLNTAACLIVKKTFDSLGGFKENLVRNEDGELALRLFHLGFLIGGTTRATSRVLYRPPTSSSITRVLLYLFRSFEAKMYLLVHPKQRFGFFKINVNFLNFVWKSERGLIHFALATEVLGLFGAIAGALLGRHHLVDSTMKSGAKTLAFSLRHNDSLLMLKNTSSFMFSDEDVYTFIGGLNGRKLRAPAAEAVTRLATHQPLQQTHINILVNSGLFASV